MKKQSAMLLSEKMPDEKLMASIFEVEELTKQLATTKEDYEKQVCGCEEPTR